MAFLAPDDIMVVEKTDLIYILLFNPRFC